MELTTLQRSCPCPRQRPCCSMGMHAQHSVSCQAASSPQQQQLSSPEHADSLPRRAVLSSAASAAALWQLTQPAHAVQGLTAGRLPGLKGPDSEGWYRYTRPEGKSGGHGVGWTEIPRYSFRVPPGWQETPVSIADLGGTEIDLRFGNKEAGSMEIVVAPVLRFMEEPPKGGVKIEDVGGPDRVINGFHPEIFGKPLEDGQLVATDTRKGPDGLTYYTYDIKPHNLVAATAYGNRLFIMALKANGAQWRRNGSQLREILDSFSVTRLV